MGLFVLGVISPTKQASRQSIAVSTISFPNLGSTLCTSQSAQVHFTRLRVDLRYQFALREDSELLGDNWTTKGRLFVRSFLEWTVHPDAAMMDSQGWELHVQDERKLVTRKHNFKYTHGWSGCTVSSLSFAALYLLNYGFARKFQQNTGVIKLPIVVWSSN